MHNESDLTNLEQLLDRIDAATRDGRQISLDTVFRVTGRRTFGPILLVCGLITLAPIIGDIPGVPTVIGIVVFLVAVQLLFNRSHFWLPHFLLKRSVTRDKLDKALEWLRPPARFVDRFLRPRLAVFVARPALYVIAIACLVIALSMPAMEVIPFSANLAGAALTAFGFSLIARDGLFALLALTLTAGTAGIALYNLL